MKRAIWRAAVAGILGVLAGCGGRQQTTNLPSLRLRSLDGGAWNLREEAGKIVVLQFFATFDNSSIGLVTKLERLHIDFRRRGVRVIGVAMDPPTTARRREVVEAFCALTNVTFDVMLANEALGADQTEIGRIPTIPATVIFDRHGDPVASATGIVRRRELEELLEAMIEGEPHPLLQRPLGGLVVGVIAGGEGLAAQPGLEPMHEWITGVSQNRRHTPSRCDRAD